MENLSIILLVLSFILLVFLLVIYLRARNLKGEIEYVEGELNQYSKANAALRMETKELEDRLKEAISKVSTIIAPNIKRFKPILPDLVNGDIIFRHPGTTGQNVVRDSTVYVKIVNGVLEACYFTRRDGRKQVKVPVGILSKQ